MMVGSFFPRSNRVQNDDDAEASAKQRAGSGKTPVWAASLCAFLIAGGAILLSTTDSDLLARDRQLPSIGSCPPKPKTTFIDPVLADFTRTLAQHDAAKLVDPEQTLEIALALRRQCTALTERFSSLRNIKADPTAPRDVFNAIVDVHNLEIPLRTVLASLRKSTSLVAEVDASQLRSNAESSRMGLNKDFITMLTAARELAAGFQDDFRIRRASSCYPDLLAGIEALVVADESYIDQVQLGLYRSQVAFSHAPFFGKSASPMDTSTTMIDSWGSRVPEAIAKAENLLLSMSCDSMEPAQAKLVALRLREHAQLFLATVDAVPATAEVRYRAGAHCAARAGLPKISSQLLARLGYFMSLRGRQADALGVVGEALAQAHDPLAAHLHASLRLALGELRTDEDVRDAVSELQSAKGRMPPLGELEAQRSALHSKLSLWGVVAATGGGIRGCFEQLTDVALLAICVVCRLVYN
jgi:hypothetical protein